MNKPTWEFREDKNMANMGLHSGGIELFNGAPLKCLAREICQNSIDARTNKDKEGSSDIKLDPVRIDFHPFTIDPRELPEYDKLHRIFEDALDQALKNNSESDIEYLENSLNKLNSKKLNMLRISDHNTTGLVGADQTVDNKTTPWYSLVNSTSASHKSDDSIGSFGTGKLSAFACSDLQTVFYSTVYEGKDHELKSAYQGVSKLLTINNIDGNYTDRSDRGHFCCINEQGLEIPVLNEQLFLDNSYNRSTTGTDIYICGFQYEEGDWEEKIISAVLSGFFYAIAKGRLIVKINDKELNKDTIDRAIKEISKLNTNESSNTKLKNEDKRQKDYTSNYYSIMTNFDIEPCYYSILDENDVCIKMQLASNLETKPKIEYRRTVAIIRKPGMKILDMNQISGGIAFSGICIIEGKQLEKLLSGTENIRHDAWEPERYKDPEKRKKATKAIKTLRKIITNRFKELLDASPKRSIIPNLGNILPAINPDPGYEDTDNTREGLNDIETQVKQVKTSEPRMNKKTKVKKYSAKVVKADDDTATDTTTGGFYDERENGGKKPGNKPGSGPGDLSGDNPSKKEPGDKNSDDTQFDIKSRWIAVNYHKGQYKLYITSEKALNDARIELNYITDSNAVYPVEILSATINGIPQVVVDNKINHINFKKSEKTCLKLHINYSDLCTVEVNVHEA